MTDKPKRRWYQFSLRTLFVLTTLFAIFCSWYAYEMRMAAKTRAAERQKTAKIRAAVAKINSSGGEACFWDDGKGTLALTCPKITDAGLVHVKDLTNLTRLFLHDTQITDAGIVHLKGLTNLTYLGLRYTQVTDAGLVHLEGLTNLNYLGLRDTQVTDEGVKQLQEALPNCKISR